MRKPQIQTRDTTKYSITSLRFEMATAWVTFWDNWWFTAQMINYVLRWWPLEWRFEITDHSNDQPLKWSTNIEKTIDTNAGKVWDHFITFWDGNHLNDVCRQPGSTAQMINKYWENYIYKRGIPENMVLQNMKLRGT